MSGVRRAVTKSVEVVKLKATSTKNAERKEFFRKAAQDEKRQKWAQLRESGAPFPVGQKKVFLPNFVVTLQYNPLIPPTHAQFQVPLNFNKFDLRDYLWHAYSVKTLSVRSQVVHQPIRFVERGSDRNIPGKRTSYRPRSLKRMIVKLDKPFVWPSIETLKEDHFKTDMYRQMLKAERAQSSAELQRKRRSRELSGDERSRQIQALVDTANALMDGSLKWKGLEKDSATAETAKSTEQADEAVSKAKVGEEAIGKSDGEPVEGAETVATEHPEASQDSESSKKSDASEESKSSEEHKPSKEPVASKADASKKPATPKKRETPKEREQRQSDEAAIALANAIAKKRAMLERSGLTPYGPSRRSPLQSRWKTV